MEKSHALQIVKTNKLVPVIRTNSTDEARTAVEILSNCGIKVFEITMTVPNATDLIAELSESREDILIGAGTVLNKQTAKKCVKAGAIAVGVGADLVDFKVMREGDLDKVAEKAQNYLDIVISA